MRQIKNFNHLKKGDAVYFVTMTSRGYINPIEYEFNKVLSKRKDNEIDIELIYAGKPFAIRVLSDRSSLLTVSDDGKYQVISTNIHEITNFINNEILELKKIVEYHNIRIKHFKKGLIKLNYFALQEKHNNKQTNE